MGILPALLLGAVQGVTEFWPISSSAHLALLIHIFGWGEPDLSFMVALHVGTWLAVVWYYRRRLLSIVVALWREVRGNSRGDPRPGWAGCCCWPPYRALSWGPSSPSPRR